MEKLNQPRGAIDEIDRQLLGLLARRMETVREIGTVKRENSEAPLHDAERERRVFEFWSREGHRLGLSSYFVGRILKELLAYSRRDQERRLDPTTTTATAPSVRVAFQGAPGSYSDLALEKLFASRAHATLSKEGHETFEGTLDALEAGEVNYALLPIENTIAGSIHDVYRELSHRRVVLVDEEIWRVEHCLAAQPGVQTADLRLIRSHPVALQQCSRFLRGLVGARAESWYDTAAAAGSVAAADSSEMAAICSAEAARDMGLEVLRENIADQAENHTRFVLIGLESEAVDLRIPAKTSLLLTVDHTQGALAECLDTFAAAGFNLSKLESRPQPELPWRYLFYLDVEANVADPRMADALDRIRQRTGSLRILGCYPARAIVERQEMPSPSPQVARDLPQEEATTPAPARGGSSPS